jgi:hypothetical protein
MASVIDTLVTRYTMDPSSYESGANRVTKATQNAGSAILRMVEGPIAAIGRTVTNPINGLVGALGIGGIIAAGTGAVRAAIDYDTMRRSLTAVTQSAERAGQVLKYVDQLAIPSIFTSADLGSAAKTLEAFGLQTERFLPIAEKLGTVFGGTSQDLFQFVDALGMIKGGRTGEGIESLARAGISRDQLKVRGLQFDGGGQFKGQVSQLLDAVEAEVNARFGKLSQEMASGPAARMASVFDAVGRAMRTIGDAILSVLVPAFEKVGSFIQYLVDSGAIEKVAFGIAHMFGGADIGQGLVNAIAWVVAGLQQLPAILAGVSNWFGNLAQHAAGFAGIMIGIFTAATWMKSIGVIIEGLAALRTAFAEAGAVAIVMKELALNGLAGLAVAAGIVAAAALASVAATKAIEGGFGNLKNGLQNLPGVKEWAATHDQILRGYDASQSRGVSVIDQVSTYVANQQQGLSPLNQIAANTAATAANTQKANDIQRSILGGGSMGAAAASPVNLTKALSGSGDRIQHAVNNLVQALRSEMLTGHEMVSRHGYSRA